MQIPQNTSTKLVNFWGQKKNEDIDNFRQISEAFQIRKLNSYRLTLPFQNIR